MNLHEYQAKQLFAEYGIPVQDGLVAHTAEEAVKNAKALGGDAWLVKAQVHAGGRGKAGGVKFTKDLADVEKITRNLIGSQLITKQSAPDGQPVNCVLIAAAADIAKELYLGAVVDRGSRQITFMGSLAGGMDIEEVAANTPEEIVTFSIEPGLGIQEHQCREMGFALGLEASQRAELQKILKGLYLLFNEKDLSLVEINPLAILEDDSLCAIDAKITIDDNALYRQEVAAWRDASQEDEKERKAAEFELNYVTLDGNIACMVNGAGLAMATMDIIKLSGANPANFLDVGGGTTAARVAEAFKIIVSDSNVEAILVNIFGGIVRCDLIAEGIISAVKDVGVKVPVIVRLEGTKVNEGKEMLAQSGLAIISAENLADAAEKAVSAVGGKK
ncbi:MAG: ADP-forming succinate--CoA ligase subunit beta [Proteobacteria bacterium]|jgi:succinyl-CoA synthetase beta subunit|nr:ADP-forming succinate--CoA ligase subunit beta [Pseudomonadota bacterium]MBT5064725.1 ADP-forming succinate--CoA ligase subunit beta [Pseudomonadota bacterium]MBT6465364.1 ADP-forming succinate--CoA ligase subunit beta [Pseudomonadota bacterium]MBT7245938.1 ADP-forming succinate--CoA ligase subunit beta [Pseudomonadota bacterium]MBT7562076.1 ADP-forming succinate--CoA ligase subunit beta [Pseudomonadota bacterium]